jgi:glyoxylase-like metal-dependent hydrolase (beta-lactamase superfamily II)
MDKMRCFVTIGKKAAWSVALVGLVAVALVPGTRAQQQPTVQESPVTPQIPQPNFHSAEDTWKTGVKPEDIKAGVIPDLRRLRDQLVVIPVQGNIWLIGGAGGNIAVQVSDQGILLVDAGAEAAADKVIAQLQQWKPRNLRWIIDTSLDMDHTGGNEKIAKSIIQPAGLIGAAGGGANAFNGAGAGIIAFENVLNRMSAPTGQSASRPTDAWPTDTFFTVRKNMWYGGEPIELHHVAAAHTDGDIMVFFRKSDVIVTGPILPGDSFPMIDSEKGGSITGVLAGLNQVVGTAVPEYNQQGGTRIVTGNGRIYNQTDAVEYRDTVTIVRDRIATMVKKGATLDQVKAAHVTLEYDAQYGKLPSWTSDMFITEVFNELSKAASPAAPGAKKPAATKKS